MTTFWNAEENFLRELRAIEKKWQKKWEEAHIFEANPDLKKPKFFLTVPYPYTSGPLHIGHGRTYTIGDIYARYKRMQGFNVLWPMAFHITGTPISSISSRIATGDETTIRLYESYVRLYISDPKKVKRILESFKKPENVAMFFASVISNDFKSLGYSIDWRRRFTTGDPSYNRFVTWQFLKLNEKGYLTRGTHPILYCPNDKNAVGEDDIRGGDEFKAEIIEFIGIKFKLDDSFLIAASLRPETIFGVTNLWVNPNAVYVKANVDNEKWIISEKCAEKLKYQAHNVVIEERFKGETLIGKLCIDPINERKLVILPADFVDDDNATGIVYSVPAHAPFDYVALRDLQTDPKTCEKYGIDINLVNKIKPISIISIEGYGEFPAIEIVKKFGISNQLERDALEKATRIIYRDEFYHGLMKENCFIFSGLPVSEAKDRIRKWLLEKGLAIKLYETSPRPIYCRCGARIIVAILRDQWFINYAHPEWKTLAWKALDSITIYPSIYRKLFEDTFNWVALRPCARRRGLGTRLPFDKEWIIESLSDSTIYMAFYTIAHIISKNKINSDQLIPELFDYVFLGKGDPKELSRRTKIDIRIIESMRQEFLYWYPVDLRHTAIGHITNHLTFFIFHHVAIFPPKYWPKAITLNEYVIREGAKMSKSKGNVLPLVEIPRKYSADLYRLYITYAADLPTVVDWREEQVLSVLRRLRDFWRIALEIINRGKITKPNSVSMPTKWLLSKFNSIILKATDYLENYRFRDYVQEAFFNMLNILELYRRMSLSIVEEERYWAEYSILEKWLKLLSPVIPHITEELWNKLGHQGFLSTESWPKPDLTLINKDIESAINIVERTISDVRDILRVLKQAKPSKVYIYVGPEEWQYRVCKLVANVPPSTKLSDIIRNVMKDPEIRRYGKRAVDIVKAIIDGRIPREVPSRDTELSTFRELQGFISHELGLEVYIENALAPKYDPKGKAKVALPGRPGIYIE